MSEKVLPRLYEVVPPPSASFTISRPLWDAVMGEVCRDYLEGRISYAELSSLSETYNNGYFKGVSIVKGRIHWHTEDALAAREKSREVAE